MAHANRNDQGARAVLSISDAVREGWASDTTLRTMIRDGRLRYFMVGSHYRILRSDLEHAFVGEASVDACIESLMDAAKVSGDAREACARGIHEAIDESAPSCKDGQKGARQTH
jgi:excisionase family DNA binding protein